MSDAYQQYEDAVVSIAQHDLAAALELATGTFVSLLIATMKLHGHDPDREIRVDGGENRDITVHAPKKRTTGREGE